LPVRASASTSPASVVNRMCVVKFAIAQLITNKPITLTGYLRFPVAAGLFRSNVEHAKRLWFTPDHLADDGAGARVDGH
jgi:hypothetical protein